jgi:hypothetical protein
MGLVCSCAEPREKDKNMMMGHSLCSHGREKMPPPMRFEDHSRPFDGTFRNFGEGGPHLVEFEPVNYSLALILL